MNDLATRDKNIKANWYIICTTDELKINKAIARTIYDTSYVLFRDINKEPVCLLNRCLHRLTQMETGLVENGNLHCPYHGWTYDKDGVVTSIPSEGPSFIKKKSLCSKPFPIKERDGVVWIWTGEDEPTAEPSWNFPHYNDPSWIKYFMVTDFDNEVTNLCENFMDVPHTVFVHKGWFRNKSQKQVPMTIQTKSACVKVTYDQESDKIGGIFNRVLNPKNLPMLHTDEFIYPNITRVDYTFGQEHGFIINSQNTPVSTLKSRTYTYIAYKLAFGNKLVKPLMRFYTRKVIEQDVDIMKIQSRSLEIDNTLNFRSTDADSLHVEIEKLRHYGKTNNPLLRSYESQLKKEFWI